jgi:hypothetical protein
MLAMANAAGQVPVLIELSNNRMKKVGVTLQYEVRNDGEDLYAEVSVCDNTKEYARAATLMIQPPGAPGLLFAAVMLTDRSREELWEGVERTLLK